MSNFSELWSDDLTVDFDPFIGRWAIFDGDDNEVEGFPEGDRYAPVADAYATKAAATAALAVIKAWEAPVAHGGKCLSFEKLRATSEWAAFAPYLRDSYIGDYTPDSFEEATTWGTTGGQPGAREHYQAMRAAGVRITNV